MVAQPGPRHPASQTHAPPTHAPVSEQLRSLVPTPTRLAALSAATLPRVKLHSTVVATASLLGVRA